MVVAVDQMPGTPTDASTRSQDEDRRAISDEQPGFLSRGRLRRRARFLRKARELAYRDLGGLVFNLHRFGQRNDPLVLSKLTTLGQIDTELRTLEEALRERRPVTVLREAGITACPRCAAIHGSEDRFCPNCGLSMSRGANLPIAGPPAEAPVTASPGPSAASPGAPPSDGSSTPPAPAPPPPIGAPAAGGSPPSERPEAGHSPAPAPAKPDAAPPVRAPIVAAGAEEDTEILHPGAKRS